MRALVLLGVVLGALVALRWARPAAIPGGEPPRLALQICRLPIVGSGMAQPGLRRCVICQQRR